MEEEKFKKQLNEFLQNEDNQKNALGHAQQLYSITNGGWFTVNGLRKKLHNAKRDEIKQIIQLLSAFGMIQSQGDNGVVTHRIVFQDNHKLQLLNIELGIHEQRIEVIKKEIKEIQDKLIKKASKEYNIEGADVGQNNDDDPPPLKETESNLKRWRL